MKNPIWCAVTDISGICSINKYNSPWKSLRHVYKCNVAGYFIREKPRWSNRGLYTEHLSKQKMLTRYPNLEIEDQVKFAYNAGDFMISGTCDGIGTDRTTKERFVLEYKERSRCLLGVKIHDLCQCQFYMFISGIHQTLFIESYGDESEVFLIKYDKEFINKYLQILKDRMEKVIGAL